MFKNLTVRSKLTLGFGLLVLMMLLSTALSLVELAAADDRFAGYVAGIDERALIASRVRIAVDRRAIAARNLVLVTRAADIAREKTAVLEAQADIQREIADLQAHLAAAGDATPAARAKVAELVRIESRYGPVALAIVDLALKGDHQAAIAKLVEECRPLLAEFSAASDDYAKYTNGRAQGLVLASRQKFAEQRALLLGVGLASLIAARRAGLLITRSLVRALGAEPADLGAAAQRVSVGDLSVIEGVASAPAGSVMHSLGAMQRSLGEIVGQVRGASDSIATGSAENRFRQCRPEPPHGTTGRRAGADLRHDDPARRDGSQQFGQCRPGRSARAPGQRRREPRRRRGEPGGRHHEGHQRQLQADRRHPGRHRWHRLPDQHPGAEPGGRSGARGRTWPRLRRRGRRGAQPGPTQRRGGQGDQDAHHRERRARRDGHGAGRPGGRDHDRHRQLDQARRRTSSARSARPASSRAPGCRR